MQEFLECHSFGDLAKQHGVYASFNKTGQLFSLNYDMIESKEDDLLAQECRGLVLALEDGSTVLATGCTQFATREGTIPGKTRILCYGLKRFFNLGQGSAANIDWNDSGLNVLEKLDGTLCQVWYNPFDNIWNVATRSVPEADLLMDNGIFTFRTLFEKALFDTTGLSFEEYTSKLDKEITYCFELTTPYNRIVVYYPDNRITLLAMRRITYSLDELYIFHMKDLFGVPVVQMHSYSSVSLLVEWITSRNPMEHEGVVVLQLQGSKYNRVKIKDPQYVAYNKVRDALATSERNIVELILAEKDDDVIPMLPEEIVKNLQKIKGKYQVWLREQERLFLEVLQKTNEIVSDTDTEHYKKKNFALTLDMYPTAFRPAYFAIFGGKAASIKDFINQNRKDGTWSNSFLDKILSCISV